MEFITNSKNIEWIFGGIGVATIGWLLKLFSETKESKGAGNIVNVNNNLNVTNTESETSDKTTKLNSDIKLQKDEIKIFFIDDDYKDFKIVSILKKSGYVNTKGVKDINNLDDPNVKEANIIFVDINGVGKQLSFKDQGLGLALALKEKYQNKFIVLYSADTQGDRFHKALKSVDASLYKNADPYEFINLIESFHSRL